MTQIASLLAVATVFIKWLMESNIYILLSGRGGLICETKLLMQELELKMQGWGLMRGVGVITGFYGTCTKI